MVGHGGSSACSYFADPTSPIPSHSASIVVTGTLRVNKSSIRLLQHANHQIKQKKPKQNGLLVWRLKLTTVVFLHGCAWWTEHTLSTPMVLTVKPVYSTGGHLLTFHQGPILLVCTCKAISLAGNA